MMEVHSARPCMMACQTTYPALTASALAQLAIGGKMRDDIEGAPAQRELLETILGISESGQQIPNYQALAKLLGKSQSRIPESIKKLRDKGFIRFVETATGKVRTGSIIPDRESVGMAVAVAGGGFAHGHDNGARADPDPERPGVPGGRSGKSPV